MITTLDAQPQEWMEGDGGVFRTVAAKPGTVTVSGKPSIDVPTGTLNSALKQAGLK